MVSVVHSLISSDTARTTLDLLVDGLGEAEADTLRGLLLSPVPRPALYLAKLLSISLLMMLVLVVELLNSALEALCDAVTVERHPLIGRAKDIASAAVMLCLVFAALPAAVWVFARRAGLAAPAAWLAALLAHKAVSLSTPITSDATLSPLTDAHWELIHFLRAYWTEHGVQPQVRVMIRHFTARWGAQRGSNHHLHEMFPRGGPQKQGNRLAGLLRTKGEH